MYLFLALGLLFVILALWQSQMRGTLSPKATKWFGILGACAFVISGAIFVFSPSAKMQNGVVLQRGSLVAAQNNSSEHFKRSIDLINQANSALLGSGAENKETNKSEAIAIVEKYKNALEEARQVKAADLNQLYKTFGDHYHDEFLSGLELVVKSFESNDATMFDQGNELLNQWGDWYDENYDAITRS